MRDVVKRTVAFSEISDIRGLCSTWCQPYHEVSRSYLDCGFWTVLLKYSTVRSVSKESMRSPATVASCSKGMWLLDCVRSHYRVDRFVISPTDFILYTLTVKLLEMCCTQVFNVLCLYHQLTIRQLEVGSFAESRATSQKTNRAYQRSTNIPKWTFED